MNYKLGSIKFMNQIFEFCLFNLVNILNLLK